MYIHKSIWNIVNYSILLLVYMVYNLTILSLWNTNWKYLEKRKYKNLPKTLLNDVYILRTIKKWLSFFNSKVFENSTQRFYVQSSTFETITIAVRQFTKVSESRSYIFVLRAVESAEWKIGGGISGLFSFYFQLFYFMTIDTTRLAELRRSNDLHRKNFTIDWLDIVEEDCNVFVGEEIFEITEIIRNFNDFNESDDPFNTHTWWRFKHWDKDVIWRMGFSDRNSDLVMSVNPEDPTQLIAFDNRENESAITLKNGIRIIIMKPMEEDIIKNEEECM